MLLSLSPGRLTSGLSRSKHYQIPHLGTEAVLAQSTASEHQQRRCAASAVTNSLRQATSDINSGKIKKLRRISCLLVVHLGIEADGLPTILQINFERQGKAMRLSLR
jgi:hypothetical protein